MREETTFESLSKLKAVFQAGGSTTAGNASQVTDGAAAVLAMKRSTAEKMGLPIQGVFRSFAVAGVAPSEMGIGPAAAIPPALKAAGLSVADIDVFEINEAFASQAVYCVKKLGIPIEKVNPNGGGQWNSEPRHCAPDGAAAVRGGAQWRGVALCQAHFQIGGGQRHGLALTLALFLCVLFVQPSLSATLWAALARAWSAAQRHPHAAASLWAAFVFPRLPSC